MAVRFTICGGVYTALSSALDRIEAYKWQLPFLLDGVSSRPGVSQAAEVCSYWVQPPASSQHMPLQNAYERGRGGPSVSGFSLLETLREVG